ncbi:MAG: hypothetical protein AAF573_11050 [Bacteroidota bacterium]
MKNSSKPLTVKIALILIWIKFMLMMGCFVIGIYVVSKSSHGNEILANIQQLLDEKFDLYPLLVEKNTGLVLGTFFFPVVFHAAILYSIHFRLSFVLVIGLMGITILNSLSNSFPPILLIIALGYLLLNSSRQYFHTRFSTKDDILDEDFIPS